MRYPEHLWSEKNQVSSVTVYFGQKVRLTRQSALAAAAVHALIAMGLGIAGFPPFPTELRAALRLLWSFVEPLPFGQSQSETGNGARVVSYAAGAVFLTASAGCPV